jgi:hypothetical protein
MQPPRKRIEDDRRRGWRRRIHHGFPLDESALVPAQRLPAVRAGRRQDLVVSVLIEVDDLRLIRSAGQLDGQAIVAER